MRSGRGDRTRALIAIAAIGAIWLMIGLLVSNSYYQLMLMLVPIWAVMGLSWNLLSGYTGLVSFGHASFFGLGAYTVTIALVRFDVTPWLGIPLGMLVGVAAAVLIGYPTFRLRGHYFALAMLAYPLALLYVFEWLGYQEVALPMKREAAAWYMQFSDPRAYTVIAVALLLLALLVLLGVERSRFGMSLLAIKQTARRLPRPSVQWIPPRVQRVSTLADASSSTTRVGAWAHRWSSCSGATANPFPSLRPRLPWRSRCGRDIEHRR